MQKKIEKFCQICLRVDKKLKVANELLTDFHNELCDCPLTTSELQFCNDCEYLLRKTCNFKNKCVNANNILKNWLKETNSVKHPASLLHTLLPPSSIGFWSSQNSKIYYCTYEETGLTLCDEDQMRSGPSVNLEFIDTLLLNDDIKLEEEKSNISDLILQDFNSTLKIENSKTFERIQDVTDYTNLEDTNTDCVQQNVTKKLDNKNNHNIKFVSITNHYFNDIETNLATNNSDFGDNLSSDESSEQILIGKRKKSKRKCIKINKSNIEKDSVRRKSKQKSTKKDGGIFEASYEKTISNKVAYSKERLKERLKNIFSKCGEIKTDDGSTIDKEFILNSLDNKVTETVSRLLWKALPIKNGDKSTFRRRAYKIFNSIQSKYKDDLQYESIFEIEYLTTEDEMIREFQNRKSYECYLNSAYKCETCYQGFKYKKSLEYHQKSHEVTAGSHTCSICSIAQRDKARLKLHIHKVHGAVYKCKLCPLVTYYRQSMTNHYHQHKGVHYSCEPCGMTFNSKSVYLNHRTTQHGSPRHVCTECGRAFVSELGKREHVSRKHKNVTPTAYQFKCSNCELAFPTEAARLRHQRSTHDRAPPHGRGGGLADRPYRPRTTLASLKNKIRTPRKEIVMTCRVCKATGSYYGWLYLHFRMKHPTLDMSTIYADRQKHLCHVCGKGFSSAAMLRNHLNTHTDVRPFACDVCPKRFNSNYSLYSHRLLHLPPGKPCTRCGKMFHTQSNLANHMRTHIGNRRYKCSICGKGFLHRHSLNEHVRGVHNHVSRAKKRRATETGVIDIVASVAGVSDIGRSVASVAGVSDMVSEIGPSVTNMSSNIGGTGTGVSHVGVIRAEISEIGATRTAVKKMALLMDECN